MNQEELETPNPNLFTIDLKDKEFKLEGDDIEQYYATDTIDIPRLGIAKVVLTKIETEDKPDQQDFFVPNDTIPTLVLKGNEIAERNYHQLEVLLGIRNVDGKNDFPTNPSGTIKINSTGQRFDTVFVESIDEDVLHGTFDPDTNNYDRDFRTLSSF